MNEFEIHRIISALPSTKDGKAVVPGLRGCYVDSCMDDNPVRSSIVGAVTRKGWNDPSGCCPYCVRDGSQPSFSSEKLAMDHRARIFEEAATKARNEAMSSE